jgi:hypothetical protein
LIVRAADGQAVAYVYYFDERQGKPGRLVSREEAEDVAARIVALADGPMAPATTVAAAEYPAAVEAPVREGGSGSACSPGQALTSNPVRLCRPFLAHRRNKGGQALRTKWA